jgi:hypothetical protein
MVANKYVMHFTIRSVNSQTNLKNIVLNKQPSLSLSHTHTHTRSENPYQVSTFKNICLLAYGFKELMALNGSYII